MQKVSNRLLLDVRTVTVTDKAFGAVGDGVTNDTPAFMAAVSYLASLGGGTVLVPPGTFLLDASNPSEVDWDNRACLWVQNNNIHIKGAGKGATTLKLKNGADAYVVKFGKRTGGTVTVSDCSLSDLTIDGNRANQTTPGETDNHWSAVDVVSNCQRIEIADLYIHDAAYYGVGMQRDGIKDSAIRRVTIDTCGADGIDWKNDSGTGTGNFVEDIIVKNFGQLALLSNPQAGVDLRSGVTASRIYVSGMAAATDLVGVRTLGDGDGTATTIPTQPTTLRDIFVLGNSGVDSVGVRLGARNSYVENAIVKACADGVRVSRPDCRMYAIQALSNVGSGIRLTSDATAPSLEADTAHISGALIRDNAAGIIYDSVDEVSVVGCDVRNNTGIGHDVRAGSTNINIRGGSISGNGTNLSDSGTATRVQDTSGFRTKNVVTGTAAIDSTGVKNITIAHGLAVTPAIQDVQLTLERNTNVGDWVSGFLWVTATDATNITAQLRVTTASATVGALVTVKATVEAKRGG